MNDTITVTALIVIVSFAIDRIAAAVFFLLSFIGPWNASFPDPASQKDDLNGGTKRLKLAYYVFVGALTLAAVVQWDIRLLGALGVPNVSAFWDYGFSIMVLMGGSGQIAELLGAPHAAAAPKASADPIEIRGRITLDEDHTPRGQGGA